MRVIGLLVLTSAASACIAQLNIQPEIHAIKEAVPGTYTASISYPVFKGDTPVVDFANNALAERANRLMAEFKKAMPRTRTAAPSEALVSTSISFYTTELITGVMSSYMFTGGAHGNSFSLPYNFAIVNGKPKELKFSDVFRPGTGDTVSQRVLAKLKGVERASFIADGSVSSMTADQLNRFIITKVGVKFLFDHYELGPYISGAFNVTLLFSEIDDVLLPNGPACCLIPR